MWSMIIFLKKQLVSFLHKNVPSAEEKIKIAEESITMVKMMGDTSTVEFHVNL